MSDETRASTVRRLSWADMCEALGLVEWVTHWPARRDESINSETTGFETWATVVDALIAEVQARADGRVEQR